MHTQRFGRKLKLPSTIAIKHGLMTMMLRDQIAAEAAAPSAPTATAGADESLIAPVVLPPAR